MPLEFCSFFHIPWAQIFPLSLRTHFRDPCYLSQMEPYKRNYDKPRIILFQQFYHFIQVVPFYIIHFFFLFTKNIRIDSEKILLIFEILNINLFYFFKCCICPTVLFYKHLWFLFLVFIRM